MKLSNQKRNRRQAAFNKRNRNRVIPARPCFNCGQPGPHFVPPSFGDAGFYICTTRNPRSPGEETTP